MDFTGNLNKYKDMLKMFPEETEETLANNFQNAKLKKEMKQISKINNTMDFECFILLK